MEKSNLNTLKQSIFIILFQISSTLSQSSNDETNSTIISSNETLSTSPTVIINNSSTTSSNLIGLGWTLFIILIGSSFLIIVLALVYIVRRGTPYRRFLRDWRIAEDDRDEIILDIDQVQIVSRPWTNENIFS